MSLLPIHRFIVPLHVILLFLPLLASVVCGQTELTSIKLRGNVDQSSYETIRELTMAYKLADPDLSFHLTMADSTTTITSIMRNKADFGITIQGWSALEAAAAPNMQMVPIMISGFVPCYRLNLGYNAPALVFTRAAISGIYTGRIHKWNDPEIVRANPLVRLPDMNITLIFDNSDGAQNSIIKFALNQFNSSAFAASGMQINSNLDYPFTRYASSIIAPPGANSLVTSITANDGSFGLALHALASSEGAQTGLIMNKIGIPISITTKSLTYAAMEKGSMFNPHSYTVSMLTDCENEHGYALSFFIYLVIDTEFSASSCKSREALVEFFLMVQEQDTAISIMSSRGLVPVPELVRASTNSITLLTDKVMCRGQLALKRNIITERPFSVSEQFLLFARLLASVYDSENTLPIVAQAAKDDLMISQLAASEIGLALVTPDYVDASLWKAMVDSDQFLVLPLIGAAAGIFFNPILAENITIDSSIHTFTMDTVTLIGIFKGCIQTFNHPSIIDKNAWLIDVLGNTTIPIVKTLGCAASGNTPLTSFFYSASARTMASVVKSHIDPELFKCLVAPSKVVQSAGTCSAPEELNMRFVENERTAPLIAMGTPGSTSFQWNDGETSKMFANMKVVTDGLTTIVEAGVNSVLACASDTFNPTSLSFDFTKSKNPNCWPMSEQMVAIVRKQYWSTATNTSSCSSGLAVLQFLRWFYTTEQISVLANSFNVAPLQEVPGVFDHIVNALNGVMCDDDTLLIKLPHMWDLDSGLFAFGITTACIGIVTTLTLIGSVLIYHRNSVMRSASPIFILVSLFGVLMMYGGAIALVSPVSDASCSVVAWMLSLGMMTTFLPIFMKVFRIYKIFGGRKLSVVKMSNRKLMNGVGLGLAFIVLLMSIWQAQAPLHASVRVVAAANEFAHATHYTECSTDSTGNVFLILMFVIAGLLLLSCSLMSWSVKKVSQQFNESSQVALTVYNTMFTLVVVIPVIIVIDAQGDVRIGIMLMALLWISFFTGALLVLPKLHTIYNQKHGLDDQSLMCSSGNSSGFSFMSLDVLDSLPILGTYMIALRKHMEQVEQKQALLKRSKAQGFDHSANNQANNRFKGQSTVTTNVKSPSATNLKYPSSSPTLSSVNAATARPTLVSPTSSHYTNTPITQISNRSSVQTINQTQSARGPAIMLSPGARVRTM